MRKEMEQLEALVRAHRFVPNKLRTKPCIYNIVVHLPRHRVKHIICWSFVLPCLCARSRTKPKPIAIVAGKSFELFADGKSIGVGEWWEPAKDTYRFPAPTETKVFAVKVNGGISALRRAARPSLNELFWLAA